MTFAEKQRLHYHSSCANSRRAGSSASPKRPWRRCICSTNRIASWASPAMRCGRQSMWRLRLLHPAPFGDKERGGLGGFAQRVEIHIFVEAVHRRPAGAEAEARDVVVQSVEPRIRQRGERELGRVAAIDRIVGLA